MENNDIERYREMIQDETQFETLIQQLDESEGVSLATLISVAAFETPGYIPSMENAARLLLKIIKKRGFFLKLVDYLLLYPKTTINCWEDMVGGGPGDDKTSLLDDYMITLLVEYNYIDNEPEIRKVVSKVVSKVLRIIDIMKEK